MPLFKCNQCGAVENTALGAYWHLWEDPVCSECDTGQWHGKFEKVDADAKGYVSEGDHPHFIRLPST